VHVAKQKILIGIVVGIGMLLIAYGFYQWERGQPILPTFPSDGDCGSYSKYNGRGSNDNVEISEKQKAVVACMVEAYKSCEPATATETSTDWEGGSLTTKYQIRKTDDGDCVAKQTSQLKAWYAPERGPREVICTDFSEKDNKLICGQ